MCAFFRRPRGFRRKYQSTKPYGIFPSISQNPSFGGTGLDLFYQSQSVQGFTPNTTPASQMMFDPKTDPYALNPSSSYDVKPFASYYGSDLTSQAPPLPPAASPQNLMSRAAAAVGYDPMSSYLSMSQSFQMQHAPYSAYNFPKSAYPVPECALQSPLPNTFHSKPTQDGKDYFAQSQTPYMNNTQTDSECSVDKNYTLTSLSTQDAGQASEQHPSAYPHAHTQQVLAHDVNIGQVCGDGRKVTSRRFEGSEHLSGVYFSSNFQK